MSVARRVASLCPPGGFWRKKKLHLHSQNAYYVLTTSEENTMPVTLNSVVQVLLYLVIVLLITKPMGLYLTNVFAGERTWLSPVLIPVERVLYKLSGVHAEEEYGWK